MLSLIVDSSMYLFKLSVVFFYIATLHCLGVLLSGTSSSLSMMLINHLSVAMDGP